MKTDQEHEIIAYEENRAFFLEDLLSKHQNLSTIFDCSESGRNANIHISILYSTLADHCLLVGLREKAAFAIKKSLTYDQNNFIAIANEAHLDLDENTIVAERKFKKSLYLANSTYDGKVPAPIIILVYAGLGYVYQKRAIYESAEEYWTKVIDMRPLDFIRSIALLNRGQARLETNRLEGAVADLNEVIKESKPEVAALAHVNLGKAYFRQGLYEQAKQELLQAIKLKPDTAQAYYNMGVLLNSEGKPERAKKLFQTALTINSNYAAAKNVTSELDRAKVKKEEWLDWWTATRSRKVGAFVIIISLALIAVRPILNSISNLQTPASTFGIIGVIIIFFLLPFIKKLKVGPIELEMESIDKRLDLDIISRTK